MTTPHRAFAAPLLLASAALIVALGGFATTVAVGALSETAFFALRVASLIVPPSLLALAGALLLARRRDARPLTAALLVGLVVLGASSAALFSLGFSASMADADAGRPLGTLGRLTYPAAIAGVVLIGAAVVLGLLAVLGARPGSSRSRRVAVAWVSGAATAAPAFIMVLLPTGMGLLAFAVVLVLTRSLAYPQRTAAAARVVRRSATGDALVSLRWLAGSAIAILGIVWAVAAFVGVSTAGRPIATVAMGAGAACASLAAIPLLFAAGMIGRRRAPGVAWRAVTTIAAVGILAGAAISLGGAVRVGGNAGSGGTVILFGVTIAGLSVGAALATAISTRLPDSRLLRIASGTAMTSGGCLVWSLGVAATGGIVLAIPAVILLRARTPVVGGSGYTRPAAES